MNKSHHDHQQTRNLNVARTVALTAPRNLEKELPATKGAIAAVVTGRQSIQAVLHGEDHRLLVVVGPCSIHDPPAALEYADRLVRLQQRYADRIVIVMRVYFEKPRTTVGWKGMINDPHMDGTFDVATGLCAARKLLLDIAERGLPSGTEMLDPITPQYIGDLVSWASIGARTTESQTHRQMASGLSMPVGFKNSTDGNVQVAIDAMRSARSGHHFLGIDEAGRSCIVTTRGNSDGHLILRGGADCPNYTPAAVSEAVLRMEAAELAPRVMIDCSHANSGKKHEQQEVVWQSLIEQRVAARDAGSSPIVGAMIESNLFPGAQKISENRSRLRYGVSVTDECIGWEKTEQMLEQGYEQLSV